MSSITNMSSAVQVAATGGRSSASNRHIATRGLLDLPADVVFEILTHVGIRELSQLQSTSRALYQLIMTDSRFTYYNTLKFFELYHKRRLLAVFLFPYLDARYSYRVLAKEDARVSGERRSSDAMLVDNGGADGEAMTVDENDEDDEDLADNRPKEDGCGNTVIHTIAANGLIESLRHFLAADAKNALPRRPFYHHWAYNHEAARHIYLKRENRRCKLVNLLNDEPNTPLHYISIIPEEVDEQAVIECARLLIQHGADLQVQGRAGNTVLAEAAQHGQYRMVKMLLEEARRRLPAHELPTYVNKYNDYHENAVIMSSRSSPEVMKLVVEAGGDPNTTRRGYPLLAILASAFKLDRRDPVTFDAYHRQRTTRWQTRMPRMTDQPDEMGASDSNPILGLTMLLKLGADARLVEPTTGMSPLHFAAFWGNTEAASVLINVGRVDPNAEVNTQNGWLPVHYACLEGQVFALQTLIAQGARVWDRDGEGAAAAGTRVMTTPLPRRVQVPAPLELLDMEAVKVKLLQAAAATASASAKRPRMM